MQLLIVLRLLTAPPLTTGAPPAGTVMIPEEEARKPATVQTIRHRVVPRETIEQLAFRYQVREHAIRTWNELEPDAELEPGDTLKIRTAAAPPQRVKLDHEVTEGDTWVSIARAHGANASDLRVYNYRRVGRELAPGEVVTVWADPTIQAAVQADDAASLVPPGAFSIGPPQRGELVNGVALPELSAYVLRFPNSAYGTTHAVRATVAAVTSFRASSSYAGELRIGAMSRQRGGPMGGHASHQSGRDLDIRLPLRAELPQRLHPKAHRVDWLATWRLVQAFIETGAVSRIFLDYKRQGRLLRAARAAGVSEAELERVLQYPRGWGADAGVVRHSSGHKGHLHVRFGCADYETECVE